MAVLTVLVVLCGVWWSWSLQNRHTTSDPLAGLPTGFFEPGGVFGDQPRRASDGSLLPPAGQEESPTRLLPVVSPVAVSDEYAFVSPSEDALRPYGWSPCRPVHYVVDLTGAPAGFEESVGVAVVEISTATGLLFVDDGMVIEAANPVRESYQPAVYGDRWAPVLIRFADDLTVPGLAGDTVGQAGGSAMTGPSGITHYVSGTVYLNVELLGMPGLGGVPAYLPVLRHELGHLVGLDHIEDPSQLMYPTTGFAYTFQAGDLAGLSLLGQAACAPDL
ncbi:Matrixin [Sanguibacter gelidistatuariae]|uniref:Matrixin n=1 Tax=Sanguibacter gelidistatuariae TaxID=1814289 RepID=A0A1G6HLK4_9MICO|nr:Matrixin [Sanguibacter gelidistatuariae]